MINEIPIKVMKRNRCRCIAISDELVLEIRKVTKDYISVSAFIRMALKNELEKYKKSSML
ncbi:MAG: hypothetical protein V1663_04110 [archaeon]